jgi:hypothetical protein
MTNPNECPMCGQIEPPRDPNRPANHPIWVLTRSFDDTQEHGAGGFFVHAWIGKPTEVQLTTVMYAWKCWYDPDYPQHLMNGGGRRSVNEYMWFELGLQK